MVDRVEAPPLQKTALQIQPQLEPQGKEMREVMRLLPQHLQIGQQPVAVVLVGLEVRLRIIQMEEREEPELQIQLPAPIFVMPLEVAVE